MFCIIFCLCIHVTISIFFLAYEQILTEKSCRKSWKKILNLKVSIFIVTFKK